MMPKSVKRFADDIMLFDCEPFRQMAIVCRRRKSPGPGRTRNGRLSISVSLILLPVYDLKLIVPV